MKVLFLGNSHTFFNDMPQIFKNICAEKGKDVEVGMLAHPGVTYGWHYKQFTDLRFALMWGGYDYIVMQQAAHSPCPEKEETLADGEKIIELAREIEFGQLVVTIKRGVPVHVDEVHKTIALPQVK